MADVVNLVDPVDGTQVQDDPGPDIIGGARDSAAAPVGVDPAVDQPQGIGQRRGFEICAVGADDDFDVPAPLVQARD